MFFSQIRYFATDNLKEAANGNKRKNFKGCIVAGDTKLYFAAIPMLTKVRKIRMLIKSTNSRSPNPLVIGLRKFEGSFKMMKEVQIYQNS